MAPVVGSGACPACIANDPKPILDLLFIFKFQASKSPRGGVFVKAIVNQSLEMKKSIVLIIFLAALIQNAVLTSAMGQDSANEPRMGLAQKINSAVYSPYKRDFQHFCAAMERDGRLDSFLKMLNSLRDQYSADCQVCKVFYKVLAESCKSTLAREASKKKRVSKKRAAAEALAEAEANPSPSQSPLPFKQREPSPLVLDLATTVFGNLANGKVGETTLVPFDQLLNAMMTPTGKTAGEQEYFMIVSEYVKAAFSDLKSEIARRTKEHEKQSTLESLFGR